MKLQFVSDVACPWCAIGLNSLEIALNGIAARRRSTSKLSLVELNPDMPSKARTARYVAREYGSSAVELAAATR